MIKISVIIPVYNVAPYLSRCLESLINQTLKDIEIICIEDCSTDNSLTILHNYEKQDSRIKVIAFDTKQNAAIARNTGLEIAQGEYLGFVDSDDFVDLDFYEKLYHKAIETGADIVKGSTLIVDLKGDEKKSALNNNIPENKMSFLGEWWSAIYRRDMILKNGIHFPAECPKAQDSVFLTRCLLKAHRIELLDNCFYHYIRRENSLDSKKLSDVALKSEIQAISLILDELNENYPQNLTVDEYLIPYEKRLEFFVAGFYRTDDTELKSPEIKQLLKYYHLCKEKVHFWDSFPYHTLKISMENQDQFSVFNELNRYKNIDMLGKGQILFKLRQNVKGEKK